MRAYIAFVKKEFVESARTYKLLIILAVFLLFGMMNPIAAKIMPEIMSTFMPEGMSITLQTPVAMDSWIQFYKNITGIQIIVFVIVFSGMISNELTRGTLINMLTKGLPRRTIILSKFTSTSVLWTLSYLLCFTVTYGYTLFLLPNNDLPNIFFSAFCMWLFGELLITVMIFGGVLFRNIYGSLLFTGGFAVILMLLNMVPNLQKFNPFQLASSNISLLNAELTAPDFIYSMIIAIIIGFICIISAIIVFDKKHI